MPIYHIPDTFNFDVDRLIEELRIYKVNRLSEFKRLNHGKEIPIKQINNINDISSNDLNKILRFIKKEVETDGQ